MTDNTVTVEPIVAPAPVAVGHMATMSAQVTDRYEAARFAMAVIRATSNAPGSMRAASPKAVGVTNPVQLTTSVDSVFGIGGSAAHSDVSGNGGFTTAHQLLVSQVGQIPLNA